MTRKQYEKALRQHPKMTDEQVSRELEMWDARQYQRQRDSMRRFPKDTRLD